MNDSGDVHIRFLEPLEKSSAKCRQRNNPRRVPAVANPVLPDLNAALAEITAAIARLQEGLAGSENLIFQQLPLAVGLPVLARVDLEGG